MARDLAQIRSDGTVGSVAWIADNSRPLAVPPNGNWMLVTESDKPKSGDIFSSACPIRFAPPFDTVRYNQVQVDPITGASWWLYNTQGQAVHHNGLHWLNTLPTGTPNVWEPGVANWRAYQNDGQGRAVWFQPSGAWDAYPQGFVVRHQGRSWVSGVPANVWEPGVANWSEVV